MRCHTAPPAACTPRSFGASDVLVSGGGMTVSSVTLPPQLGLSPHSHDSGQLCVVLEGHYDESASGRTVPLSAGSVLWRPAGVLHANRVSRQEVHALLVDFEPDRARRLAFAPKPHYFSPGIFDEVHRELAREMRATDE